MGKKKKKSLIDYDGADDDEAGKDDENSLLDNAAPGSGTKKAMKAMKAMAAMKAMKTMKKKKKSLIDYDGADDDEAGEDDENSLLQIDLKVHKTESDALVNQSLIGYDGADDDEAGKDDEHSLLDNA